MSYSNRKVIKNYNLSEEPVYIEGHLISTTESYLETTMSAMKEQCKKEIDRYRKEKFKDIDEEVKYIKEQAYESEKMKAKQEVREEILEELEIEFNKNKSIELQQIKEKYDAASAYYQKEFENINSKREEWLKTNNENISDFLSTALKKIIFLQDTLNPELVSKIITEATEEVNSQTGVLWVKVHPLVKENIDTRDWKEDRLEFVADSSLSLYDVVVENRETFIDATLENKLKNIKNIIEEWVKDNEFIR